MELTSKQKAYWNNANARWNIKVGATRSGKTWLDYYMIPKRILERKGKEGRIFLIGNTQSTLERNVLEPLREIYGSKRVGIIQSNNKVHLFGDIAYAIGADKVSQVKRIQGASVKYCYGDEVATWSKEVFEMLKSRLDKEYSCFDGTLNPENETHWFKKEFIDKSSELDAFVQHYTIDDNKFLPQKFVDSLKNEYRGTVYYDRFILGLWKNAEGLLFPQLADCPSNWYTKELPKAFHMVCIGLDIGGTKSHTTLVCTGIHIGMQKLTTFAERKIVHNKGTIDTDRICNETVSFIKQIQMMGYPVKYVFVDNAEQVILNTVAKAVKSAGLNYVHVQDCKKFEGKDRILIYNLLLNTHRIEFKDVPIVIDSLTSALYDENALDDKILDDFTTDIDTFDAHFYSFSSFANQIVKKG